MDDMPFISSTSSTCVGLGLRRELIQEIQALPEGKLDFLEVAPENWLGVGGKRQQEWEHFSSRYPIVCHGLSLSLGGPAPLDIPFLTALHSFLDNNNIDVYTEHLSYCSDEGHLYDLLPIPFTEEAAHYVARRVSDVQDKLQRQIAIENISYYVAPGQEMPEIDFINTVLDESGCALLLDVNNVYVNSVNHQYDAKAFIKQLNPNQVFYIHIAGHIQKQSDLLIDTHGENVTSSVWDLLALAYQQFGVLPTLLERDFDIPPLADLMKEVEKIRDIQIQAHQVVEHDTK